MTNPAYESDQSPRFAADHVNVSPAYEDPDSGALWVHKDLVSVRDDWDKPEYVAPRAIRVDLGNLESWVYYIEHFRSQGLHDNLIMLRASENGLVATLNYHAVSDDQSFVYMRADHDAVFNFQLTPEARDWFSFANGQPKDQKKVVEFLEDHRDDITFPDGGGLITLLSQLRAHVTHKAESELRPDGTTKVEYFSDKSLGGVELPPVFEIRIPIMKGHRSPEGAKIAYALEVRLRAVVADGPAPLQLRFSLPKQAQVMEEVSDALIEEARQALPKELSTRLLRAAS